MKLPPNVVFFRYAKVNDQLAKFQCCVTTEEIEVIKVDNYTNVLKEVEFLGQIVNTFNIESKDLSPFKTSSFTVVTPISFVLGLTLMYIPLNVMNDRAVAYTEIDHGILNFKK